ncbi:MAG TPA: Rieske (2Fe-2S) protein [Longimicrobiales bacterium]|nr:Rieske (2Fe-2S) protein [Longimicrobiales bacterium]
MAEKLEERGDDACASCAAGMQRREFLRDAAAAAAAILLGLGARRADAAVLPRVVSGLLADGEVAYPVPAADGASIDREQEIILVRWQGKVYAFNLSCPHQHTALRWQPAQTRFECPKHHSKYQPDGEFISGRATRSMDRFAVRSAGGQVFVDPDRLYRQDQNAQEWASAYVTV